MVFIIHVRRVVIATTLKTFLSFESNEGSDWSLNFVFFVLQKLVNLDIDVFKLLKLAFSDNSTAIQQKFDQILVVVGEGDMRDFDITFITNHTWQVIETTSDLSLKVLVQACDRIF